MQKWSLFTTTFSQFFSPEENSLTFVVHPNILVPEQLHIWKYIYTHLCILHKWDKNILTILQMLHNMPFHVLLFLLAE